LKDAERMFNEKLSMMEEEMVWYKYAIQSATIWIYVILK
jgi:hypothetical protein